MEVTDLGRPNSRTSSADPGLFARNWQAGPSEAQSSLPHDVRCSSCWVRASSRSSSFCHPLRGRGRRICARGQDGRRVVRHGGSPPPGAQFHRPRGERADFGNRLTHGRERDHRPTPHGDVVDADYGKVARHHEAGWRRGSPPIGAQTPRRFGLLLEPWLGRDAAASVNARSFMLAIGFFVPIKLRIA